MSRRLQDELLRTHYARDDERLSVAAGPVLAPRPTDEQPPPAPSSGPAVWDLVLADMRERDVTGRRRYGTPLRPGNGRDALTDAYQEALDLAVYLRQAIYERDGR